MPPPDSRLPQGSTEAFAKIVGIIAIAGLLFSLAFVAVKEMLAPEPTPTSGTASITEVPLPTATLTATPTATFTPTTTPTVDSHALCNVVVGELLLGKKIITTNQETTVSVTIENPDNTPILFNWRATYGSLNPGLRTSAIQSTYTPPLDPSNDAIFLEVDANGCNIIQRVAEISIVAPSENDLSQNPTNTVLPSATPTPVLIATPTAKPSLVVESFENYTDASLKESYFLNTYAGNEGTMRLVGVPHNQHGLIALAFEYTISHPQPNHYIGFEREFPSQDWSDYTKLCVWIEWDGSNRGIVMQFGENAGRSWKPTYPLTILETGEYCIPITASGLNLASVGYYGIYIEGAEGSSTVYFDNIHVTTD